MKCSTYSDASSGKTATLRADTSARDFAQISHASNSPVNFQCYCINKSHKFFHSLHSFLLPFLLCLVAHRALTEVFHFSRSAAIFLASFCEPRPVTFRSFYYCPSPRRIRRPPSSFHLWRPEKCTVTIIIAILPQDVTNSLPYPTTP